MKKQFNKEGVKKILELMSKGVYDLKEAGVAPDTIRVYIPDYFKEVIKIYNEGEYISPAKPTLERFCGAEVLQAPSHQILISFEDAALLPEVKPRYIDPRKYEGKKIDDYQLKFNDEVIANVSSMKYETAETITYDVKIKPVSFPKFIDVNFNIFETPKRVFKPVLSFEKEVIAISKGLQKITEDFIHNEQLKELQPVGIAGDVFNDSIPAARIELIGTILKTYLERPATKTEVMTTQLNQNGELFFKDRLLGKLKTAAWSCFFNINFTPAK